MTDSEYLESHLGPIDFLVVEFPAGAQVAEGFRNLLGLIDQQVIRVLDFEFITRREDGTVGTVTPTEIADHTDFDLSIFEGAAAGFLSEADVEEVAGSLQPGSIAGILDFEEIALLPILASWEAGGATVIGEGAIEPEELVEALDATE